MPLTARLAVPMCLDVAPRTLDFVLISARAQAFRDLGVQQMGSAHIFL